MFYTFVEKYLRGKKGNKRTKKMSKSTYVSRQTGAIREQRKAWA